jgi:hypothetical protein
MRHVPAVLASIVVLGLGRPAPAPAASGTEELARGIRQVSEGDFENAVLTLDGAVRSLAQEPARVRDLSQAYLHLGIAYVALDQRERARASFKEALARDKELRLGPDRYSPKVIAAFEEARQELRSVAAPAERKGGSRLPLLLLGAGAVAGGTIALVAGGGSSPPPPSGEVRFTNARFATPVLVCPDGSASTELPLSVDFDAANGTAAAVTVSAISSTLIIVASPAVPSEVGFASSLLTRAMPTTVPAQGSVVIRAETTLLCANGSGDAPRFNEWTARLTLSTASGVFTLETVDRLRVNIP